MNPDLDLGFSRIIKAPRARIWRAWTEPDQLAQWWLPAPHGCKVEALEIWPGGAFVTLMNDGDGPFGPHVSGCVLAVEPERRLVFTNMLSGGWRPAKGFMTTVVTLEDHPDGTAYAAQVMHKDKADRDEHEAMGFHEGWGAVTDQLTRLVGG